MGWVAFERELKYFYFLRRKICYLSRFLVINKNVKLEKLKNEKKKSLSNFLKSIPSHYKSIKRIDPQISEIFEVKIFFTFFTNRN